jgi:sulfonate transport system substrate-binding protein
VAARPYAGKHADIVRIIIEELARVDEWGLQHPKEVAAVLAAQTGLDAASVDLAVQRYSYGVKPLTPAVITEQQRVADAFTRLKLISKPLRVADIVWQPTAGKANK